MSRNLLSAAIAAAFALPLAPVMAQESGGQQMMIEEVVVTARKREETLQDVPISIAARTEG